MLIYIAFFALGMLSGFAATVVLAALVVSSREAQQ